MNHPHDALADLRFAVAFAQMDLASENHKAVSDRIRDFFTGQQGLTAGGPFTDQDLTLAQTDTMTFLSGLARGISAPTAVNVKLLAVRIDAKGRISSTGTKVLVHADGKLRDRFLYRLAELLEYAGAERLRFCPECGLLFLKVTRKEYCSTKCQKRVWMRAKRHEEKASRGRRRHVVTTRKK